MRKILTLLFAVVLTAQFSPLTAQTTTMITWKNGNVRSISYTADIDSVTFQTINVERDDDGKYIINGHKFVDMGLPSGLLWAETNLGATQPTDVGNYYAWGETTTKAKYSWSTYKFTKEEVSWAEVKFSKYDTAGKDVVLDQDDDAVNANWGSPCRMPSYSETSELFKNSTIKVTTQMSSSGENVSGVLFTSKQNGNTIFFPMTGYYDGSEIKDGDKYFYCMTRSLGWASSAMEAYCYGLGSSYTPSTSIWRYYGAPTRAVAEP